eukprot:CAMPEP_0184665816 /NCGR_PEP_ID=MMETSP0308-20130426/58747_1 /TAXON_ID=38269 /ORGANISM="Gloeochaete witrockiana, Strain SAG 46.84" /LENGTH=108 /DNA_ID=CAMNT_0027110035 /DNA_START=217 /DNA_END=539 /DNA_ORIENTATION=-
MTTISSEVDDLRHENEILRQQLQEFTNGGQSHDAPTTVSTSDNQSPPLPPPSVASPHPSSFAGDSLSSSSSPPSNHTNNSNNSNHPPAEPHMTLPIGLGLDLGLVLGP